MKLPFKALKFKALLFKAKPTPEDSRALKFGRDYIELVRRLQDVRAKFDFAAEDSLIDALIYEENALLCRLENLYKEAREKGITLQIYDARKK